MIRHALFDWDGTISYLRAGWAEIMQAQWLAALPVVSGETDASRQRLTHDEIWALNGKPTIHQMARLAELVRQRGGADRPATAYNDDFQGRLASLVHHRAEQVRSGSASADQFMIGGVRQLLERIAATGVILHLASGTELRFIAAEAEWLGLAGFFGSRFHGPAGPDDRHFSKRGVMDRLLADHGLPGSALVAFGDGHVEIEQARSVDGFAVAVCSDETEWHSGRVDDAKQSRLKLAGAHFCIPDFNSPDEWWHRLPWPR